MKALLIVVAYGLVSGLSAFALYLLQDEPDWDEPWADPLWILAAFWPILIVAGPMMIAMRAAKKERGNRS